MKDLVLQGFLDGFSEARGLSALSDSEKFEVFSVSTVLRKYHYEDAPDPDAILFGGAGDGGIDSVIISVNGRLVSTKEDVDYFLEKLRRLDVDFIFIQSKTSASFDAAAIGTFLFGVEQFFSGEPKIPFRQEIQILRELKDYIYSKSMSMRENPRCFAYYVSTGTWSAQPEPAARLNDGRSRLTDLKLFSNVHATVIDADSLKSVFRELERGVVRDIELSRLAVFPGIAGVREAYIGLIAGDQFIRLITTDGGELNRELFYDNVRDFQGSNPVNKEIADTLASPDTRSRLALLNNGVTIVARSIKRTGDQFQISDFQIVNGCQTTHMIYQNREEIDKTTFVPIKLVSTDESRIITEVIKATNRQTAVLPEALESLSPFHRELEDFYNVQQKSCQIANRIYYERRSRQYTFDRIPQSQLVTLTAQTKSFVAMFLNEPHSHPRYYGELLKSYEQRLFVHDHKPAPYYLSGKALLKVEQLFNSGRLSRDFRRHKYHILMLIRIQLGGGDMPRLNSHRISDYSLKIASQLDEEKGCIQVCTEAIELIATALQKFKGGTPRNPASRIRAFTLELLRAAHAPEESAQQRPKLGVTETGEIRWYDDWKGFGFIGRDDGDDIFVHHTGLINVPWHLRTTGTRVTYTVETGPISLKAGKVGLARL